VEADRNEWKDKYEKEHKKRVQAEYKYGDFAQKTKKGTALTSKSELENSKQNSTLPATKALDQKSGRRH
jgi:hypothetical protein